MDGDGRRLMSKSFAQWCGQWLEQLPKWERYAPKGFGVTVNLVIKRLLHPGAAAGPEWLGVGRGERIGDERGRELLAWLDGRRDVVEKLLDLLRTGVDDAMARARQQGLDVTISRVAEALAVAIGSKWKQAVVLTDMEVESVWETFLRNSVPLGRRMGRREFAGYRGLYDQLWEEEGRASLDAEPYGRYGLGENERPPLVVEERENVFLGMQRSVFSRFSLAVREPYVKGSADEIARREVTRACSRLGLIDESARIALRSLHAGLMTGPSGPGWKPPGATPGKRDWNDDLLPLGEETDPQGDPALEWEGIHAGLAALAQAMIATFTGRTSQGQYLKLAERMDEAHQDAMRRAWHECFRLDMAGRPVTEARASKIVKLAIYGGIPSGQKQRRDSRRLTGGHRDETSPEDAGGTAEAGRLAVFGRALEWLRADEERARAVIRGDENATAEYERAAAELGFPSIDEVCHHMDQDWKQ